MGIDIIKKKLEEFRRKYFINKLIRQSLIFLSISLIISLLALFFDYIFRPGTLGRSLLFYSVIFFTVVNFSWFLLPWLLGFNNLGSKKLGNEEVAKMVGDYFPTIADKLLNALQLEKLDRGESKLILAGIDQKIREFGKIQFSQAINFKVNLVYVRYLAIIIVVFIITGISTPRIFTDSSKRILYYNRDYIEEAPFDFILNNESLKAFRGEDFELSAQLEGEYIPEELYISIDERLVKMKTAESGDFLYKFNSIQRNIEFSFYAAGFYSEKYTIDVFPLPDLQNFNVYIDYPSYTGLEDYQVSNIGNFTIPEGSTLKWTLKASNADSIKFLFDRETIIKGVGTNELFEVEKNIRNSTDYEIKLKNQHAENKEQIFYSLSVTKDEYPEINAELFVDTVLYEFMVISGNTSDDYGLSSLNAILEYSVSGKKTVIPIPLNKNVRSQSFYQKIDLDSLMTKQNLKVYASVRDNDRVNGAKEKRSEVFSLYPPDQKSIEKSIEKKSSDTEKELSESIKKTESLNEKLKELENRLRTKSEIEWQEEKLLKDILKEREKIEESLEKLREQYEELKLSENKFNDRSERIREQAESLQKLMDEVLDEETKKLYDELQKLMEEQDMENIQQQLSKITPNESNLEKELERALELFKRLKLETKLEKTAKDLEKLGEKQQQLAEENLKNEDLENQDAKDSKDNNEEGKDQDQQNQKEGDSENSDSIDKQEEIQKEFEELEKEIQEAQELNQELKRPEPLENTQQEQEDIEKMLEDIKNQLEQNQKNNAGQKQQQSGQQMKKLGEKLQNMQMGMQMEMMQENVDQLRQILDDLIKLSFNQEEIMTEFRKVNQIDPRYIDLSQEQLKLKDDAKIIEDSLLSLASRVAQISNFVTREVAAVNKNIDNAMEDLRDRNRSKALSDQQFAMTSINNLALLLDDVLQQMQMSMSEAMGNPQKSQKGNQELPNLKQLQQQLSEQISELQKGQKEGRKLSEDLARMAAEQEMIRNEMKKLQDMLEGQMGNEKAGGNLGELQKLMEQNEIDLVNKRITNQLIERQKDIMTRMLEAEDALREQELDPERKGEQASEYERPLPPAYEKYLKEKEKEIELLKSLPLDLNPFYKKEVNDYFRRLTSDN